MNQNIQDYVKKWDLVLEKEIKTFSATICAGNPVSDMVDRGQRKSRCFAENSKGSKADDLE